MVQIGKRGLLATVITVLFMLPLLLLVHSITDSARQSQHVFSTSESGLKAAFYEDDILRDYSDVLGFKSNRYLIADGTRWVNFSVAWPIRSFGNRQSDYAGFLNSVYAHETNLQVTLISDAFLANITPLDYELVIDNELCLRSADDLSSGDLTELIVEITVNQSRFELISNSSPSDSGSVPVSVSIFDANGTQLLADESANLDPTFSNAPFRAQFMDGTTIDVEFGDFNSSGTLRTLSEGLEVTINRLDARFKATNTTPILVTSIEENIIQYGLINKTTNLEIPPILK